MVDAKEYIDMLEEMHTRTFKQSTELRCFEKGMLLSRPDSSIYRTEFLCGQLGSLLVHGDGPDILLRTYRNSSLLAKVRFLADNGYDYIAQKVVIGEAYIFNVDVFRHEVQEDIRDMRRELEEWDTGEGPLIEALEEIVAHTECQWTMRQAIWDYHPDPSDIPEYGHVPSPNLVMAKMAAKRALELLEDGEIIDD